MFKMLIIFVTLSIMTTVGMSFFGVGLLRSNYWDYHGVMLLFFLSFFPRLALLFSSIPFGGFLWWVGFFLCPRYLIALLATLNYWHENPILVTISWFVALGGESSEKYAIHRRIIRRSQHQVIDVEAKVIE